MDKELMDCLLSDNEIYRSFRVSEDAISLMAYPSASRESNYRCIAKAQLNSPKLKAYIDSQVQAERERHSQRLQYIWLIAQKAALERALPDSSHRDTLLRPPSIDLVEEYTNCLLPKEEVV